MKTIAKYFACLGVLAIAGPLSVAQTPPTPQQTQEANLKAYINLLRQDLKKDKVTILTELMDLDPQEAAKFWPIYNEYDVALTKLADERLAFLLHPVAAHTTLEMVVDQAHRLHEGVDGGRADKAPAAFLQLL